MTCDGALLRTGAGSPLVLLHGLTASWRVWRPVVPHLTGRHDVIAPTLAGHVLMIDEPEAVARAILGVTGG